MTKIYCYRENKLIFTLEITMREEILLKQLKNGLLYYDTMNGDTEIVALSAFDKVVIRDCWLYDRLNEV